MHIFTLFLKIMGEKIMVSSQKAEGKFDNSASRIIYFILGQMKTVSSFS